MKTLADLRVEELTEKTAELIRALANEDTISDGELLYQVNQVLCAYAKKLLKKSTV